MADNFHIHIRTLAPNSTQEESLGVLINAMAETLDERQIRHLQTAVQMREETQSTYLDNGLAVPHGRTTALTEMHLCVGLCPDGVAWPDDTQKARLIVMLGVPTSMITAYLTTMQKLLRWHKSAPRGANGEWAGEEAALLKSLQQALQ